MSYNFSVSSAYSCGSNQIDSGAESLKVCSVAGVYNNLHTTEICVDMNDNLSYTHNLSHKFDTE